MTNYSATSQSPPEIEELDLDSFLRRHNAASSDEDDAGDNRNSDILHCSIDDILNDSSSDSDHDAISVSSSVSQTKTLNSDNKLLNSTQSRYSLIQRLKSDEFAENSSRKPPIPPQNVRNSSIFGGGVSRKPGAAFAAAAAASRNVRMPRAAVIKSRRALSVSLEGKVSDGDELLGFVRDDVKSEGCDGDGNVSEVVGEVIEEREDGDESGSVMDVGKGEMIASLEKQEDSEFEDSSVEQVIEKREDDEKLGSELEKDGELVSCSEKNDDIPECWDVERKDSVDFGEKRIWHSLDDEGEERIEEKNVVSLHENSVDEGGGLSLEVENEKKEEQDYGFGPQQVQESEKSLLVLNSDEFGSGGDEGSGSDEVKELGLAEDRIAQLESEIDSTKTEEKLFPVKKQLELAEELEIKQASTGQDWEEGAAAQPMRLEGVRRGSTVLGYFDVNADNPISRAIKSQAFIRDYGTSQVIAVHLNYIALGMSKGVVVVVPSKYSAHLPDNMDPKMLLLGAHADRSPVPVTSICFNQQGDLLLAGYGDGLITLWNISRGTVARVVTGEHAAPVVHTLFLAQDFQVTRQFKAVTGDCKGHVQLHEFSYVPIIGVTVKTLCLLDGQRTGTVLCASPLLPDEFTFSGNTTGSGSSIGGVMGGVGGASPWKFFNEGSSLSEEGVVIFVTHQTALVVRLKPSLEVYAQLSRPEGVREGSMPYTAWKCTTKSRGSSTENVNAEALERISLLAIAWDRKMLVILTLTGQLCLYTRDGTLIHQTSYASNETGGDDLISFHTYFTNVFGNPEKAYHNCLAVRGASIYILAPRHVVVSRLLLWRERIEVLRNAGDWMGAFNMAMTLYDGQAHGVIDLPRDLNAIQEAIMPYLVELLFSYVDEVFSYISVACFNQIDKEEEADNSLTNSNAASSEIKEQFTRVGGVAVEFCVHIRRTDILFDEIYSKFVAVQHRDTFLELLEPYILKDMLGSLPPEIMQALVEHYNSKGWLQRVEQCVLHMDISSLDFNQVVRLCRENGLYGALIYLFNKGLDDFKTPLEELLNVLRNHKRDAATAAVGYRMLVYLKYCFLGLAFPPGHGKLPSERLPSRRMELLQFLLQDSGGSKSQTGASLTSTGAFLNLHYLLELDTEATLDVLRMSYLEDEQSKLDNSLPNSPDATDDNPIDNELIAGDQDMLVQKIVDALVIVLDVNISQSVRSTGDDDASMVVWPSKKDIGYLIEFVASYVACKRANVSKSVLSQILEYLTSENHLALDDREQKHESKKTREKKVLALLGAVPQTEWNASYVLHLCEKAQFHQVCGLIHTIRHNYLAALDCYMKDVDEPVHAFSFIDGILLQLSETESAAFQSAVIPRISELVTLSREFTFCLVIYHLNKERGHILSNLQSTPRSLFLYLKTLFEVYHSGALNFSCIEGDGIFDGPWGRQNDGNITLAAYLERISEFPKIIQNNPVEVNDDIVELYLELLCQFEPDSVLKFLDTFENYRVDRCLLLCQKYEIVDAASFLLERVGDVGSALLLTLSGLNDKYIMLGTAVGNTISDMDVGKYIHKDCFAAAFGLKEVVQDIKKVLHSCIGLCQRNSPRLNPEESESLWFHVLDSFCRPLLISQGNSENGIVTQSSNFKDDLEANSVSWTIYRTQKCAPVLKRIFSEFVKEIVEGMIGYVRLPSIMAKLLSDNGSQEFGDFKLTILGMLGTYSFERRILDTAKCLIEDDTFYTMSLLKKGASKGYAPRSLQCCICNCSFKSSSNFGIRVFNCGHATHIQCDVQENATSSQSSSGGCPICVHKKKIRKAKGKMAELGLVSASPSTSRRAQSTSILHPHELDVFENSTGPQTSRFEILNRLQKNQRLVTYDTMPQLRLAPPSVYHEKVNKRNHFTAGGSREGLMDSEKPSRNKQLRDLKVKGSSVRFPLKSKIFGQPVSACELMSLKSMNAEFLLSQCQIWLELQLLGIAIDFSVSGILSGDFKRQ
uniref:RING-type domain-containing protein n=1 Tax=Chenopodium quinoa TaxID=63459 RepID=A0A803M377_CHEQI